MGKVFNAFCALVLGYFLGCFVNECIQLKHENDDLYDAIENFVGGQIKHVGGLKKDERTLN